MDCQIWQGVIFNEHMLPFIMGCRHHTRQYDTETQEFSGYMLHKTYKTKIYYETFHLQTCPALKKP